MGSTDMSWTGIRWMGIRLTGIRWTGIHWTDLSRSFSLMRADCLGMVGLRQEALTGVGLSV